MAVYLKMQFVLKNEAGSIEMTEDPSVDGGVILTFNAPQGTMPIALADAQILSRELMNLIQAKNLAPASSEKA